MMNLVLIIVVVVVLLLFCTVSCTTTTTTTTTSSSSCSRRSLSTSIITNTIPIIRSHKKKYHHHHSPSLVTKIKTFGFAPKYKQQQLFQLLLQKYRGGGDDDENKYHDESIDTTNPVATATEPVPEVVVKSESSSLFLQDSTTPTVTETTITETSSTIQTEGVVGTSMVIPQQQQQEMGQQQSLKKNVVVLFLSPLFNKLKNIRERFVPAVFLLCALWFIVSICKEIGVTIILLLLSIGLYDEATKVWMVPTTTDPTWKKWIWFVVYSIGTSIPATLSLITSKYQTKLTTTSSSLQNSSSGGSLQLVSFCLVVCSFVFSVIYEISFGGNNNINNNNNEGQKEKEIEQQEERDTNIRMKLCSIWETIAYQHVSLFFTVVPITLWIKLLSFQIPISSSTATSTNTITTTGLQWALYSALLVIINDITAYLFGCTMGKTPLVPLLSPNKTVEGYVGALFSTLLSSVPLYHFIMKTTTSTTNYTLHSFIIALYCSIISPMGGLLASSVKRAVQKKDFGTILRGHGGYMDRFDCQLITIPFLYYYLSTIHVNVFQPTQQIMNS